MAEPEPELRMSDFAKADDVAWGPRRLWLLTTPVSGVDDDERECLLVIARSTREARELAAATHYDADDGAEVERGWVASATGYRGFPSGVLGVWQAPDAVWALLGIVPSEDWRECGCCGEVKPTEPEWELDGDDCDDCETQPEIPKVR